MAKLAGATPASTRYRAFQLGPLSLQRWQRGLSLQHFGARDDLGRASVLCNLQVALIAFAKPFRPLLSV